MTKLMIELTTLKKKKKLLESYLKQAEAIVKLHDVATFWLFLLKQTSFSTDHSLVSPS